MPYELPNNKYPYPLSFLASDGGTDVTPFVQGDQTVLPASTNWYVMCLTPEQLQECRDLVEIGAPIAFPDTYISIQQLFWQMFEFPNEIPAGSCMDLCQLILDCINTTPALQDAIGQYSSYSALQDTSTLDVTAGQTQFVNNPANCDNDIIFGMTTGLVELLNSISTDMFEIIQQNSSVSGRIGDIIEAIPGVGVLPVDDIFQFVESFLQDLSGLYASKYTVQLANSIRCDLFCLAQGTCTLTLSQARIYYSGKLSVTLDTTDWLTTVTDFISNTWAGDDIVYITHYLILDAIERLGSILGFDVNNIAPIIQSLFNDPDSDWATLCVTCNTWEQTFDFTIDQQGWSFIANRGSYVAGVGFRAIAFSSNETAIYIFNDNLTVNDITEVTINGTFTGDASVNFRQFTALYYDSAQNLFTYGSYTPPNAPTQLQLVQTQENYGLRFQLYMSGFAPSPAPIMTWQTMTIKGTGVNPFI